MIEDPCDEIGKKTIDSVHVGWLGHDTPAFGAMLLSLTLNVTDVNTVLC